MNLIDSAHTEGQSWGDGVAQVVFTGALADPYQKQDLLLLERTLREMETLPENMKRANRRAIVSAGWSPQPKTGRDLCLRCNSLNCWENSKDEQGL